ncbi:hypothetical protein BOX07_gp53 [Pseudoalteromonas phage PH1]|uniref:hypothetical protein n=1 Tax=Pseudoalteromonas phage PH1 TaxID=1874540 RepID=UPI000819855C|nr:hypothetical protein BOX07_gp53 [Pseudoalteromonas phage PH1]ANY29564.1 hypothetical protein [Pseudoalteromonas phage PH1]
MSAIKSLLKAGIDALDDSASIQGKSLPNALKKMGVKDEEVKYSGVLDNIDSNAKYSKENLQNIVAGRKDEFGFEQGDGEYNWVSLPEGVDNPTYKENIYTFKQSDQEAETRYSSNHFSEVPNYLMHTRTFDTDLNGAPTRVLQEIQSDLHQTGRAKGYEGAATPLKELSTDQRQAIEMAQLYGNGDGLSQDALSRLDEVAEANGFFINIDSFDDQVAAMARGEVPNSGAVPQSPYEKSWLAKGIEREIDEMLGSGKTQLAIPIKGGNIQKQLHRADGPQKFYETQVLSTAKKLAKQNDMDFEVVKVADNSITKAQDLNEEAVNDAIASYPMSDAMDNFSFEGIDPAELQSALVVETDDFLETMYMYGIGTQGFAESMALSVSRNYEADTGEYLPDTVVGQVEQYFTTMAKNLDANKYNEVEYAVLKPKAGGSKTNLKLYSSPAAAVGAGYLYLKDGNDPAALQQELAGMGYEQEDINTIIADAQAVRQAVADGYSEDEALAYIQGQEKEIDQVVQAPPSEKSIFERIDQMAREYNKPVTTSIESLVNPETKLEPQDLLAKLKIVQPNMASVTTRYSSYMGDEVSFATVEKANQATAQRIVDMFKERGVTVEWHQTPNNEMGILDYMGGIGQYYTRDQEGNLKPLDEGFWNALKSERSELGWSVAGGVAGGKAGAEAGARVSKNPWVVGAATIAGSMLGAAGGGIIGTEFDYLRESIELSEEMSSEIAAHKALTAAESSVIGDTIGLGIFGSAKHIWQGAKRAKDLILDGNVGGAMESLKTSMFITESEAKDIAIGLQKVIEGDLPKGKQGTIAATLATRPGSEAVVSAAAAIDPQAAASIGKAIDNRARDVLQSTAELTEENAGRILVDDLSNYTQTVKKFYNDTKLQVAASPHLNKFKWNYDKLAINPVLDRLQSNITDPAVLERFALQASKIRAMETGANMSDLIELRQFVNDFKFNKRISKTKDFDALNEVLERVDGAIELSAKRVLPNNPEWIQTFGKAKAKYAEMKSVERNVIAKAAMRPGMTNETLVKNLTKYVTSLDGSFQDMMSALPMTARPKMEGAVINALTNKFADGLEDGLRVIHYPALAKELDKVSFTTPDARKAKVAIKAMAEVFKNDLNLAKATGNFQLPKMQSYLTTDPVMRAKYEFASSMFNYAKRLAPTQKSNNLALVMQAAKVLENPLNARSMKELMEEVAGDTNLTKQAMLIQQRAARDASEGKVTPKVLFYGDGNVLSLKGNGTPTAIPQHRIATYEQQKQVADTYGLDYNDKKALAIYLKQEGYSAMQHGSDSIKRIK